MRAKRFGLNLTEVRQVTGVVFPVLTIEGFGLNFAKSALIQAKYVDAVAVRIRARDVKGFHPTGSAEKMLCHTRIKRVGHQRVLSL